MITINASEELPNHLIHTYPSKKAPFLFINSQLADFVQCLLQFMISRIIFHFPANLFYRAAASENKHFLTRVVRFKIFRKKHRCKIPASLSVIELEKSP